MGFRDYDPGLNRFLARDNYNGALADLNLGLSPWTMNRYAFTGGNPISLIEDGGHAPSPDNPVSANPQLNTWLATEWDAPKKWEQQQRERTVDELFIDAFKVDDNVFNPPPILSTRKEGLHPYCQINFNAHECAELTRRVAKGEMTGAQAFETIGNRMRRLQGFEEFLDMVSSVPPGALGAGVIRASSASSRAARMAGRPGAAVARAWIDRTGSFIITWREAIQARLTLRILGYWETTTG